MQGNPPVMNRMCTTASLEGLVLDVLMDGNLAKEFQERRREHRPGFQQPQAGSPRGGPDGRPGMGRPDGRPGQHFQGRQATITADQVSVAPMDAGPQQRQTRFRSPDGRPGPSNGRPGFGRPDGRQAPATADQVLIALDQIMANRMYRERNRSL